MNKIILMGNLTRNPELRYLPSGSALAETGIAVNRTWRDANGEKKEKVTFINLVMFGKRAEALVKYTCKGAKLLVEGRLEIDRVEKDGQTRNYTKVIIDSFEFAGGKRREDAGNPAVPGSTGAAPFIPPGSTPVETSGDEWGDLPDSVDDTPADDGPSLGDEDSLEAPDLPDSDDLPW